MENWIDLSTKREKQGFYFWQFLNGELLEIDTVTLYEGLVMAATPMAFAPRRTAYEDLISSGAVHYLGSKSLKRSLADYYKPDPSVQGNIDQRNRYSNDYFDARYRHVNPMQVRDFLGYSTGIDKKETRFFKSISVDWETLMTDKDFKLVHEKVLCQRPILNNEFKKWQRKANGLLDLFRSEMGISKSLGID